MKAKILVLLNTISFVAVLIVNYSSTTGAISGKNVGQISDKYSTLVTPADYAFSIWGLIYLLLFGYLAYQWYTVFKKNDTTFVNDSGVWFAVSNFANMLWIVSWVNEILFLSVVFMVLLLVSLIVLVRRNRLELWDAPLRTMAFIWWPICFYFGWIILASVLNISSFISSLNLAIEAGITELLALVVLAAAGFIYLLLIFTRNMREAAAVGIWGLIAIYFKQIEVNQVVAYTAVIVAVILGVTCLIHAAMNKSTLPHLKIKRKEF